MFLLGTGSFVAAIALSNGSKSLAQTPQSNPIPAAERQTADAIYINGEVITMNGDQPTAEAVAVKDGKILGVGSRAEMICFQSDTTQIFDLQGKTLVPGFIDGHGHVFTQGLAATMAKLLPPPDGTVDSIAKLQETLRTWSESPVSQKFGLIIGNGYDDSQLAEQRHPTRDDLDAVSTELPVVAMH